MVIDLIFLILLVMAVFKGISKGFIVAVFSLLAFIIGIAAALKLSAVVAVHLQQNMNVSGFWLPFLSFLIVFIAVVLLIRLGASVLKKVVSVAFLGWADALAGIVLYAIMYIMAFSIILFFATRVGLISTNAQAASRTYSFVEPFGPKVISLLGKAIPFFSHMFSDLTRFFEGVSNKATH
ncbi:MAG TPA: CvpA family protein [Segetibacter sp.]|nr:CvpA family protein [Segetibacter sp.]